MKEMKRAAKSIETRRKKKNIMGRDDSASTAQVNPLNQDLILELVLANLPGQDLLKSRLVSKQWNSVVLSLFPKKLWFGTHRDGAVKYDLKNRTLESKLLSSIQLYQGGMVEIDNQDPEDGRSCTTYADIEICLQFSHVARYSESIREIKVHSSEELDQIILSANKGRLCNLRTLLYSGENFIRHTSRTFKASSLPSLRKIKEFGMHCEHDPERENLYYQAMIDAAPNLQCFINYWADRNLDFSGCRNLKHLEIAASYEDDSTFRLFLLLNQVKGTLEKLKITRFFAPTYTTADWRKQYPGTPFPVFPKLKSLEIESSNQAKKSIPGLDFSKIFPKLEHLSAAVSTEKSEDALISRYLATAPLSLTVFETTCCVRDYGLNDPLHDWIINVATNLLLQLPNLKRFRVSTKCIFKPPGSELEDEGMELLNMLSNLELPHVIVAFKENWHFRKKDAEGNVPTWWNVPMFKGISNVAVSDCRGKKGGVLEFQKEEDYVHDDDRSLKQAEKITHRGWNEKDPEYDAALVSLLVGLGELSKQWNMIKFKPVLMTKSRIKKFEESIKERNLPVQLYYAFGEELV